MLQMPEKYLPINDIVIYGMDSCIFCRKAKKLLNDNKINYVYYDITDPENEKDMRYRLNIKKGPVYIPQVIISGTHVGGYTELEKIVRDKGHYVWYR